MPAKRGKAALRSPLTTARTRGNGFPARARHRNQSLGEGTASPATPPPQQGQGQEQEQEPAPRARKRRRASKATTQAEREDEPNAADGLRSSLSREGHKDGSRHAFAETPSDGDGVRSSEWADDAGGASSSPQVPSGDGRGVCGRGQKRSRERSDEEVVAVLEKKLVDYKELQADLHELQSRRRAANTIVSIIAAAEDPELQKYPVVRLVVGGESFTVPIVTLLSRDYDSYFGALLQVLGERDEKLRGDLSTTVSMASAAALGSSRSKGVAATDLPPSPATGGRGSGATAAAAAAAAVGDAWRRSSSDTQAGGRPARKGGRAQQPQTRTAGMEEEEEEEEGEGGEGGEEEEEEEDGSGGIRARRAAVHASPFPADVFTDSTGAIFIDRDPDTFRHILNYLRGYNRFHMLEEEELHKLRVDAKYFQLQGLQGLINEADTSMDLQFQPGPGINTERTRFRVVYSVATIGETFMVTGRHTITFQILSNDYVGLGVVSDAFTNTDAEFHKTPNSAVYYMSGVFYTNYPNYRKEEGLAKFENGDYVTFVVDMDKGFAEVSVKKATKLFSLGGARRLKFAVTLKLGSTVRIVPPLEAAEQQRLMALEEAEGSQAALQNPLSSLPLTDGGSTGGNLAPPTMGDARPADTALQNNTNTTRDDGRDGNAEPIEGDYVEEDDFAEEFIEGEEEEEEDNAPVQPEEAYAEDELFQD